jgi:hypothetical protein
MAEHEIEVVEGSPTPSGEPRFVGVCSCGRWRSGQYPTRGDVIDKTQHHALNGDAENRAAAAMQRGTSSLKAQLAWYDRQSEDPLNSDADREVWRQLADDVRERLRPRQEMEGQDSLF